LDEALTAFAGRRLEEPFPYLILDARYWTPSPRTDRDFAAFIAIHVEGQNE
jgi:transposase-like protein